jgi:hypothetical protein
MKVSKLFLLLSVLVVLAIGMEAYMAQEPNSSGNTSVPQRDANLTTLSKLLANESVRVDSSLVNLDSLTYRELRVRWQCSASSGQDGLLRQAGSGAVSQLASVIKKGTLPRDRTLELSPNQILLIGTDASGMLRWWKLFLDPRLVRAEAPDETGALKGEEYYLKTVDFIIDFPDEAGITEVRLYHPRWTGKEFQLELLSKLPVI